MKAIIKKENNIFYFHIRWKLGRQSLIFFNVVSLVIESLLMHLFEPHTECLHVHFCSWACVRESKY